ncbi:hypothetical protein RRG08_052533, partial [Elysia crispata]
FTRVDIANALPCFKDPDYLILVSDRLNACLKRDFFSDKYAIFRREFCSNLNMMRYCMTYHASVLCGEEMRWLVDTMWVAATEAFVGHCITKMYPPRYELPKRQ